LKDTGADDSAGALPVQNPVAHSCPTVYAAMTGEYKTGKLQKDLFAATANRLHHYRSIKRESELTTGRIHCQHQICLLSVSLT